MRCLIKVSTVSVWPLLIYSTIGENESKLWLLFFPKTKSGGGGYFCIYSCIRSLFWNFENAQNFKANPWQWQSKRLISPFPPFVFCKCLNASPASLFGGIFSLATFLSLTVLCLKYFFFFFFRTSGSRKGPKSGNQKDRLQFYYY